MLLERTKLEFYTRPNVKNNGKGPKRGFLFSRNKKGAKVYTRDELVYNGFKEQLSRLCILSSFLEDYSIVKLIGQGSYGKVKNSTTSNSVILTFGKGIFGQEES